MHMCQKGANYDSLFDQLPPLVLIFPLLAIFHAQAACSACLSEFSRRFVASSLLFRRTTQVLAITNTLKYRTTT